jgi:hypothetical protein
MNDKNLSENEKIILSRVMEKVWCEVNSIEKTAKAALGIPINAEACQALKYRDNKPCGVSFSEIMKTYGRVKNIGKQQRR